MMTKAEEKMAIAFQIASESPTDPVGYAVNCLIPAARQELADYGDSVIETPLGDYSISGVITNAFSIAKELHKGMVTA
jgi:hypothetical protein